VRLPDLEAVISSIDTVGFVTWLGISLIAGTVLYRLATALEGARDEGALRETEIGSIFALGQALSGSLDVEEISRQFVAGARRGLDPSVTVAVLVYDDAVEAFRVMSDEGRRARRGRLLGERAARGHPDARRRPPSIARPARHVGERRAVGASRVGPARGWLDPVFRGPTAHRARPARRRGDHRERQAGRHHRRSRADDVDPGAVRRRLDQHRALAAGGRSAGRP